MNEGTGTSTADTSGVASPNPGTLVAAPTWTTGNPFFTTSGLLLSGSNQYVTMGASPGLRSSTFTVELWFRRTAAGVGTSTGTGGVNAIPLDHEGTSRSGDRGTPTSTTSSGSTRATGKLAADFEEAQRRSHRASTTASSGTRSSRSNVWHHAAATYDGSAFRLYLDGAAGRTTRVATIGQPPPSTRSTGGIGVGVTSDRRRRRLLRRPDRRGPHLEHRALVGPDPGHDGLRDHHRPGGPARPLGTERRVSGSTWRTAPAAAVNGTTGERSATWVRHAARRRPDEPGAGRGLGRDRPGLAADERHPVGDRHVARPGRRPVHDAVPVDQERDRHLAAQRTRRSTSRRSGTATGET